MRSAKWLNVNVPLHAKLCIFRIFYEKRLIHWWAGVCYEYTPINTICHVGIVFWPQWSLNYDILAILPVHWGVIKQEAYSSLAAFLVRWILSSCDLMGKCWLVGHFTMSVFWPDYYVIDLISYKIHPQHNNDSPVWILIVDVKPLCGAQ